MKYAGLLKNDFSAAPGVSVSFFVQGCPIKCKNCHNPEAQDFDGGKEFTPEVLGNIIKSLTANGITRNFCVLGGEPLCEENLFLTDMVISEVKRHFPDTKIYVWTGYIYEEIIKQTNNSHLNNILNNINVLIDGPYIDSLRDIALDMRGSSNQRILKKGADF